MPLRGNLQNLRLGDVLQTILASGGHGLLRVRSGTRRAVLQISERGLHVLEPEVLDDRMVLDAFVRRGAVASEVLERARKLAAGKGGDASVLETLLIGGSIDRAPFDALLGEAAEDAVLDVLAWKDGDFAFDEGAEAPRVTGRVAEVALDPSGLLLRSAQRLDEHAQVTERIGAHALLLIPTDGGGRRMPGTPSVVQSRLDGHRLLDEIALEAGITLFAARKAAAALVDADEARLPTAEELAAEASARDAAGDTRAAAALLRQWHGTSPDDAAPIEAALALAQRASRTDDETAALRALGTLHLRANRPADAHDAFERLAKKLPGDRDALDGKRQAARALGDLDEFARTTRTVASADLEADDATHAADILDELLVLRPDDVEARLLRTKALTRAGRRDDAVTEFGRLAEALPKRCVRRLEREAATYARSTLAKLAPEETELLTRFQRMLDAPARSKRVGALVGALVVVLAGVGFVLWPASPASLLAQAQTAAERGEMSRAIELLDRIETDHGDAPEAMQAAALRRQWTPSAPTAPSTATGPRTNAAVVTAAEKAGQSFPRWPRTEAVADTEALIAALRGGGADGPAARRIAADKIGTGLLEAVTSLRRDAQTRRDALDGIAILAQHPVQNVDVLGEALERARQAMDPAWSAQASRAGEAARRLTALLDGGSVPTTLSDEVRGLEADVAAATRAITGRTDDVTRLAREHHRLRVLDAYETARTDGARRLGRGDLAAARAELNRLRELLATTERETSLRPLLDGLEKRGVMEFLATRDSMSKAIDEGLASALEAERTGNLAGASAQYARLVRQFPLVRFDDVFTIPLRVECVPPTAKVSVNGKAVDGDGSGTIIVRYGWGSSATLAVSAPGYEPASVVLDTSAERPRADLAVRLIPARKWAAALPGTVEAPVFVNPAGVVVATRSGRLECRDVGTGAIRWTVETRCVEGVRGRAAVAGDQLYVPLLDGRVARIAMSTGGALPPFQLKERPVGDAAAVGARVAFAMDSALAVFTEGDTPTYVPLPAPTTAGVLSALGAFWVGDATGGITRVDAASLMVRTVRPGGRAPVVGLASDDSRVYALTEDGALHAVGGADQQVAWHRPGLGDVFGSPAVAGGVVAVAERSGRIVLLQASDGEPRSVRETGSPSRDGLVASGNRIVAALSDGRLWVYDAAKDMVIVDAPLEGTARIGPTVADDLVVAPAAGNGIAALPLPK